MPFLYRLLTNNSSIIYDSSKAKYRRTRSRLPFVLQSSKVFDFNPNLNYPPEVKGLHEKGLYKETYLKQARILAKESMKNGPGLALLAGGAFLMLVNL